MTIRNKQVYMANLWDWGFLDDCFGGSRIRVTDVDGLIEHNGFFLLIEAKSAGKDIPRGQQILFEQLTTNPRWAVLTIWGAPNAPERAQFWGCAAFAADTAKIKQIIARWYNHAHSSAVP